MIKTLSFCIIATSSIASIAQSQHTVEGLILSRSDSAAIPFASIYINQHTGTIANEDGYFKLTSDKPITQIAISHVNYEPLSLPADHLTGFQKIYLFERSFQLAEVTVSGNTAETEIKLAIKKSSQAVVLPVSLKGYYSEFVKTNGQYEKFADGIIQYYIPQNYKDEKSIDAKVLASRAIDLQPNGEIDLDLASPVGVRFALRNYNVSRLKKFLDSLSFDDYKFGIVSGDDDDNAVIHFSPKPNRKKILYEGLMHISKENNLIKFLDYKIAEETVPFAREVGILVIKVRQISGHGVFIFDHHPDSHHYLPVYIREEFGLKIFNNKIDQSNVFIQQFQLLEANPVDKSPIRKSEEYSKKALYKNGTKYTERFWESANLIQATKEEEEIVKKTSTN